MSKRDGFSFTDQLPCTPHDDENRRYFVPLPSAKDEEMAHRMADAIYSACAERFADDITQEEADRVYEQCLADSRRMICDQEYDAMIAPYERR
jgi:DNA-binding GntR family transcriptional regulator